MSVVCSCCRPYEATKSSVTLCAQLQLSSVTTSKTYCKTLNVSNPFISRAKQNREFKGCEYQLQAKIGRNYYSISNCVVLIRRNQRGQNNLAFRSPAFWAAKLKCFTVATDWFVKNLIKF